MRDLIGFRRPCRKASEGRLVEPGLLHKGYVAVDLWALIERGEFPRPVRDERGRLAWRLSDIPQHLLRSTTRAPPRARATRKT